MDRSRGVSDGKLWVLNAARMVLVLGVVAAVAYAFLVGPLVVLAYAAAPLALLATGITLWFGGTAEVDASEASVTRAWEVVLWWVAGCAVGGFIGGLGYVTEFVGDLVLFGGALGVAQWVVLQGYLRCTAVWMAVSLFGWTLGSLAQLSVEGAFPGVVPAVLEATGNELFGYHLFEPVRWAVFGFAQALVLLALTRGRSVLLALLWVVASASGGAVDAAMIYFNAYPLEGLVGGMWAAGVRQGLLCALYGIPTGLVLAGLLRRARVAGEGSEVLAGSEARGRVLTGAGLLLVLGIGILGVFGYLEATGLGCDEEERAVFAEFPQYGGRNPEPEANTSFGTCAVAYETRASKQEVQDYYAARLRENGWRVTRKPTEAQLAPPERTAVVETVPGQPEKTREVPIADAGELISAERDGYYYDVSYESLRDYLEPRPGLHVVVHVGKE